MQNDIQHRFHVAEVMELFPQLKYNPFRDRLFRVFSSQKDEHFSFEDFLDLCSAMHENCPLDVKALWAFKVYGEFFPQILLIRSNSYYFLPRFR